MAGRTNRTPTQFAGVGCLFLLVFVSGVSVQENGVAAKTFVRHVVLIVTLIDAWTTSFEPTHNEKVLGRGSFAVARSQAGSERSSPRTVFMLDQPCWCVKLVGRNMTHDATIHNELTQEMAWEGRV